MSLLKKLVVPVGDSSDPSKDSESGKSSPDLDTPSNVLSEENDSVIKNCSKHSGHPMYESVDEGTKGISTNSGNIENSVHNGYSKQDRKTKTRKKGRKHVPNSNNHYIDPLEIKYLELNEILMHDYVERKKTKNKVVYGGLEVLCEQYVSVHGRPPPVPGLRRALIPSNRGDKEHLSLTSGNHRVDLKEYENDNETISRSGWYRYPANLMRHSATTDRISRPRTTGITPGVLRRSRSAGGNCRSRRKLRSSASNRSESLTSGKPDSSTISSPRHPMELTDCHLKQTENVNLLTWLKHKNKILKEEKRKKRDLKKQERNEQMDKAVALYERSLLNETETKKWMVKKQKEAWQKSREEKLTQKFEMRDAQAEKQLKSCLKGLPALTKQNRGNSNVNIDNNETCKPVESTTDSDALSMPKTIFMYKRPAVGRIRFKVSSEDTKKKPPSKKKETPKEGRMSYDLWLKNKREEENRKTKTKIREESHVSVSANTVLKDVDTDKVQSTVQEQSCQNSTNVRHSTNQIVNRQNTSTKRYPKPPRCPPHCVNSTVKKLMDGNNGIETNPFRLPFPTDLGVPRHVAAKQRQLFADRNWKPVEENTFQISDPSSANSSIEEALDNERPSPKYDLHDLQKKSISSSKSSQNASVYNSSDKDNVVRSDTESPSEDSTGSNENENNGKKQPIFMTTLDQD